MSCLDNGYSSWTDAVSSDQPSSSTSSYHMKPTQRSLQNGHVKAYPKLRLLDFISLRVLMILSSWQFRKSSYF